MSTIERRQQKWRMIVDRGGRLATCDLTGEVIGQNGDMHELIQRGWTKGNPEARNASFSKLLCGYLSSEAHRQFHDVAPTDAQRDRMWQKLYVLYGYEAVAQAYNKVRSTMVVSDLPKLPLSACNEAPIIT